ncbi:MAG: hypothetical protein EPO24_07265 [Bacteroidetes bacterium]|nr:MAG: hypothetical protein EPO24_07265 [Bacteroidota bacterium]
MYDMRFLADMNISPLTVNTLKQEGFNVIRVSDLMPANTDDEIILPYAITNNYILITQDLDFTDMLALQGLTKPSVINIRLEYPTPARVARRVSDVVKNFQSELITGCVVSVDEISARYRLLPIKV